MPFGKVDKSLIVKKYVDIRITRLKEILEEHIVAAFGSEVNRIKRIKTKDEEYLEVLGDELSQLGDNLTDVCNLFCVGLYSRIEPLLNMLGHHLDASWHENHIWKNINEEYKKYGIDLATLPKFREINIVRLINNCVKHKESKVSEELQTASNNLFIKDEDLKTNSDLVISYFKDAEDFFYALIDRIKSMGKYG